MTEEPAPIIKGLKLLMRMFPDAEGIIAIENNKPEAISIMTEELKKHDASRIKIVPLTVKYPQGAEKMLDRSAYRAGICNNRFAC